MFILFLKQYNKYVQIIFFGKFIKGIKIIINDISFEDEKQETTLNYSEID